MTMTIGRIAEAAGVNVATIRYYERRGIIPQPRRTLAGYRQYEHSAVDRIRFIRRAQELGFTLDEIEDLLALNVTDPAACHVVEDATRAKLDDVDAKLRDLERLRSVLADLVRSSDTSDPMTAHMQMMSGAGVDSMQAMLPMHRQMAANMLAQMNWEMREMSMTTDARWNAGRFAAQRPDAHAGDDWRGDGGDDARTPRPRGAADGDAPAHDVGDGDVTGFSVTVLSAPAGPLEPRPLVRTQRNQPGREDRG